MFGKHPHVAHETARMKPPHVHVGEAKAENKMRHQLKKLKKINTDMKLKKINTDMTHLARRLNNGMKYLGGY